MDKITIIIEKEFTDIPGPRYRKEGKYSGEEFREDYVIPKYLKAREEGKKLYIDLDETYGYGISFIEETFGGLARKYNKKEILETLEIKLDDDPDILKKVFQYIKEA